MVELRIVVWVILIFMQKRTKKYPDCFGGRPGFVFPINFLNPRHKFVYVMACGALASTWFQITLNEYSIDFNVNKWGASFVSIFFIMYLLLVNIIVTFPLLACVEAPVPIVGYTLGAIYSDVYLGIGVYNLVMNLRQADADDIGTPKVYSNLLYSQYVIAYAPEIFCIIGIVLWYHYKIIRETVRICRADGNWKEVVVQQPQSQSQIKYVKRLLYERNPTFFKKHINTRVKLPFSLLIVCIVDAVIIFQLVTFTVFLIPYLFDYLKGEVKSWNDEILFLNDNQIKIANRVFDSLTSISVLSPILAVVILVGHFIHVIYSVQVELKEFRTGGKKLFKKIKFPSITLSSSVRYAGYQIAAVITAWFVYYFVIFVLLSLVAALIIFPSQLGYYYYKFFVLVAWFVILTVSQIIICKLLFVAKESSSMKTLIITNKRMFCFFSYVMLLYNIATGLMTAILRVTLSFLSMVILLPRMDRLLFLKGFERFDSGFNMYKSFVLVENLLKNPVLQVFVMLLQSNKKLSSENHDFSMKMMSEGDNDYILPSAAARVSTRARNRWFVAYTLIKNPKLRKTWAGGYTDKCDDDITQKVDVVEYDGVSLLPEAMIDLPDEKKLLSPYSASEC
ncbi:PREDICTED: stimulated by retinoic acid gene 6 protein-like [Amphimedon queenslandica]|uniref:Receptor for retinol uptake STRA6 n=2 Tax=Amphimedon queenslandica TaxID=400682 RepID=A0AAN0J524_AMPQE|nr:PREDICTED: stimulated by retinoic acid gene 6 protein-like [Amphimedon queenslandica]|eukprot:XP_019851808.1 PREDICTED: stimulated by retinoic acid gene 6 protein-like [Amphimedon queenslandica]